MGHIHELYDYTASALILHEGKVLLVLHKKLKKWMQPGGHIELDEDPEQALWREIEEETGLKREELELMQPNNPRAVVHGSKALPIPFDLNVHTYGDGGHKHIDFMFVVKSSTQEVTEDTLETDGIKWFSRIDLDAHKSEILPDIYTRALLAMDLYGETSKN